MGNCISKAKARKSNKTNTLVRSEPLQLQGSSVHVQAAAAVASALQIDNLPAVTESDDLIVEDLESEEATSHNTPDIPSTAARDVSGKVVERSNTLAQRSMLQLPPAMSALCTKTTGLQYLDSRRRLRDYTSNIRMTKISVSSGKQSVVKDSYHQRNSQICLWAEQTL